VPLEGHWGRVNTPVRELGSRERRVAVVAAALTAIAILALVLATAGRSRPAPAAGCIRANVPMVMGAEELNLCGAHARRACASHAGDANPVARTIEAACREAGVPQHSRGVPTTNKSTKER
jgi:hypothetical protein